MKGILGSVVVEGYKNTLRKGLSLLEMVIALAMIMVIAAAILPQLKVINDSWASKQANSEVLQNARVLTDQINRSLSTADKIISVSDPCDTNGYIEFKDNTGTPYRIDIAANNYIEFGPVGSLSELAGPVSQLKITCYSKDDFTTPTTVASDIRFVKAEVIFTNPGPGQDRTFTTSTYLRTNASSLIGWWKLDDPCGLTATDSSGNNNDGTLNNMAGDEWTGGAIGGALDFVGTNEYIAIAHIDDYLIDNGTMALWFYANDVSSRGELFSKDSQNAGTGGHLTVYVESSRVKARMQDTSNGYAVSSASTLQPDTWYHVALTWGSGGMKLYLDGVEVDTDSYTGGLGTSSGGIGNYEPLALGACTWISGDLVITPLLYYFDGTLDDVRFYNRVLTTEEIAELSNLLKYREFTEAKANSQTTSITIDTPVDTTENDLLIAALATDTYTSLTMAPPFGEGWNEIDTSSSSGQVSLGAWWKLANASESTSHTFTWSGGHEAYAWMMRFTGHDISNPIYDYATNKGDSASPESPTVTTANNSLILRIGGFDNTNITRDAPGLTGHTAITMDGTSEVGAYGIAVWHEIEVKDNGYIGAVSGIPALANNNTGADRVRVLGTGIIDADVYVGPGGDPATVILVEPGAQLNGTAGVLDAEVTIPILTEPSLGASVGDRIYNSGTTTLSSDLHCNKLTVQNNAILRISGDVTILAESDVLIDDDAKIELLAGATLTLYGKTKIWFAGNSEANVNTADPSRFKIMHMGSGAGNHLELREYSVVYAEGYGPNSHNFEVENNAVFYGNYKGKNVRVQNDGIFYVDVGLGGLVSGGAGYKSSSGSSGTSDFSLTDSNKYCTLTIGIAPDPSNEADLIMP